MDIHDRLTADRLNINGCFNILCELLGCMAEEFRFAYRNYLNDQSDIEAYIQYEQIKDEFKSDYFHKLTSLNGNMIVRRLESHVRKDMENEPKLCEPAA